jgi:1-aminocyclopropane-1-carboxylate deaminase/D-cysteine desulfhydrase-like pyridoxal-dependent ACC family enzyme
VFSHLPRSRLATLPTPLERGPELPGGVRLWLKRDDLTGLGLGGNKVRKMEFLCGAALDAGARSLVAVGAADSNHCRVAAAAGAKFGLEVHLVLSGDRPRQLTGNQLLSALFGAQLHFTGIDSTHWGELEIARESLADELESAGARAYAIPIGGSTPTGAVGYALCFAELMDQCEQIGIRPACVVHASSSGGTHAGLVAGRAIHRASGHAVPDILAIGVARGINVGMPDIAELAGDVVELGGCDRDLVQQGDVWVDADWIGENYGVPSRAGDAATRWAARNGGWILDRVYTAKGFAGLIGNVQAGKWPNGSDVVFIHTGGTPSVFSPEGAPPWK